MTYYNYFSSFEAVETRYNSTKPIGGIHLTPEDDVRPIGNRRRKWERIVKISKNCYALVTYSHVNNVNIWGGGRDDLDTLKDVERTAPIVWRKHKDGSETVTIHNSQTSCSTGWYEFLRRFTPAGIFFYNRGVHKIEANTPSGRQDYILPFNKFTSKRITKRTGYETYIKRNKLGCTPKFEKGLTFQRGEADGRVAWTLVSESYNPEDGSRGVTYVDKDAKAKLKPQIEQFRDWAMAIAPMLTLPKGYEDRTALHSTLMADIAETAALCDLDTNRLQHGLWGNWWFNTDTAIWKHAVAHEDSPARMAMVYGFLLYNRSCRPWGVDEDTSEDIKRRFNTYMNRSLGLVKKRN